MKLIVILIFAVATVSVGAKQACDDQNEIVFPKQETFGFQKKKVPEINSKWELTQCYVPTGNTASLRTNKLPCSVCEKRLVALELIESTLNSKISTLSVTNKQLEDKFRAESAKLTSLQSLSDQRFEELKICNALVQSHKQISNNLASYNTGLPLTTIGKHKYYVETKTPRLWSDASRFCQANQMEMLNIDSPEKHRDFTTYFKQTLGLANNWWFWIDGNFDKTQRRWEWRSNDSPISNVLQRHQGKPDLCIYTFREGCGLRFADWGCKTWTGPFICQTKENQ